MIYTLNECSRRFMLHMANGSFLSSLFFYGMHFAG